MGRTVGTTDSDGGTLNWSYNQNDVLRTVGPAPAGENAKSRQVQYDALGRPTSVCEVLSSGGSGCGQNTSASGYLSSYTYTVPAAGGSQSSVTQGSQTRAYVYDSVGRLISETNPESGTVTYTYDSGASPACVPGHSSQGDIVERRDARGSNCYYYDSLHRVTDIGTNITGGYCRRFRYDNSTGVTGTIPSGITISNPMGRLVEAETDNCTQPITPITDEWFSYDGDGNQTDIWELTPHSGMYYHSTATFAANGTVTDLRFANITPAEDSAYVLDGEGRLSSQKVWTNQTIVTGVTYNGSSEPTNIAIGTGSDQDIYSYDSNTGRMTGWTFDVGTKNENASVSWNANGTLRQVAITDGFNSGGTETCNFGTSSVMGYDDLGRILSANCGSAWSQTFSYDQYGNITKSGSLTWNPGYSSTTNQYTLAGTAYDSAGNLASDSFNTYTWDAYGKLASINSSACGTSGQCITYDAFLRAVEISNGSAYTEVWYTQVGKTAYMNGSSFLYAYFPTPGGGTLLQTTGYNYYYEHKDWLGTARISSNLGNAIIDDRAFAPFGEMYKNFGSTNPNENIFTGDSQDILATGQCCFDTPNRELSANEGRWLSPDPAGLSAVDFTNPQTLNRYSYVLNNPNSYIDPTGTACYPIERFLFGSCGFTDYEGFNWNEFDLMNLAFTPTSYQPGPYQLYAVSDTGQDLVGAAASAAVENGTALVSDEFQGLIPVYGNLWVLGYFWGAANNGNVSCNSTTGICVPATMVKPRPAGCGAAIAQGAISLGLDVVGAIPAFGNVVSATAAGARAVNGIVAYGGAAYGIATGLPDESPVGAAGAGAGLGLTLADTALEGGKVIPVLGNFLSAGIGLYDGYQLAKTIGKCW